MDGFLHSTGPGPGPGSHRPLGAIMSAGSTARKAFGDEVVTRQPGVRWEWWATLDSNQ